MKKGIYLRLAATGISKNKKIYFPYILTSICMVTMLYIITFLSKDQSLASMCGGDFISTVLSMGTAVMAIFAAIFLFYTNSFLTKRRKKEFGLYNILGMGKPNIAKILAYETLIIYLVSVTTGIICGILFSKLAQLAMTKLLDEKAQFDFKIEPIAITSCIIFFAVIFVLILLNNIRQIHVSNPIELINSTSAGEKPPKSNMFLAVAGVFSLITAYCLALTSDDPISALSVFFVAVILVIVGTYLLLIAGSVALCKILQKIKGYYYKTNHFVSVSSMSYRMKRNGAGLASICILCTMVLVMVSSTGCLFLGKQDTIRGRYPRNIVTTVYSGKQEAHEAVEKAISDVLSKNNMTEENTLSYKYLSFAGELKDDTLEMSKPYIGTNAGMPNIIELYVVLLSDYNKINGSNESLNKDEVIIYCPKSDYKNDTFSIGGVGTFKVSKTVNEFIPNGEDTANIIRSVYIAVSDEEVLQKIYEAQKEVYQESASNPIFYHGFDLDCSDEVQSKISAEIGSEIMAQQNSGQNYGMVKIECVADEKDSFVSLAGSLLFLGIMLGIVFIIAAVLIMYYKQITEGYEDRSRFDILQKVGMTKKEVKKCINSQVLTVFFLPLLIAGLHIAVAFKPISKLLILFGLLNTKLLALITLICFVVFAICYTLVYIATSKAYYSIVSDMKID